MVNVKLLSMGDTETYGAKAVSLTQLMKLGYKVPAAWVLPASDTFDRPRVAIPDGIKTLAANGHKFAVRSGAAVSMPGLLQTKLNVHYSDLHAAIAAIWNSWNTAEARAYRKQNNINHSMGTGAIVQRMVDAEYAGVVFTADPADYARRWEQNITVEGVKGLGDALVSGTSSPCELPKQIKQYIINYAVNIHAVLGPSDIEWAWHKVDGCYFLQHRSIKFVVPTEGAPPALQGRLITKGVPIGAPVSCLVKRSGLLLVDHFSPELYTRMIKAPAIISRHGGALCHAAIIARAANKPAISGIDLRDIPADVEEFFIDGATGWVAAALDADSVPEVVTAPAVVKLPPLPNVEMIKKGSFVVDMLLLEFYEALHDLESGEITEEACDTVTERVAHIFASYQFIIIQGEMRHLEAKHLAARAAIMLLGLDLGTFGELNRRNFIREKSVAAFDRTKALALVKGLAETFDDDELWPHKGSVGGKPWAEIANLLHNYMAGEISPVLYVDRCFNIQHNCGRSFNKMEFFIEKNLQVLLNAKNQSYGALVDAAMESLGPSYLTKKQMAALASPIDTEDEEQENIDF